MARRLFKKGRVKDNTSLRFDKVLAIISIIGFLGIALNTLFNIGVISDNTEAIILTLLGLGLIFEGNLRKTLRSVRDGVSSDEFAKVFTITIGSFVFITGILAFFYSGQTINAIKGFASAFAVVWILVEAFLVK